MIKGVGFLILSIFLLALSCKKVETVSKSEYVYFPAGRSFLAGSSVEIFNNNTAYNADTIADFYGGYWFRISRSVFEYSSSGINIRYTRRADTLQLFKGNTSENWVKPSYYIDSQNPDIILKAGSLTNSISGNVGKAKAIMNYIANSIQYEVYTNSFLDKASITLSIKKGSCMNLSRLYVALCRAANIPSRTVWGLVYGYNNDNIYDYHHQWAEIRDEDGYWHPVDFSYSVAFDLNNIRYLDLIYAAEENLFLQQHFEADMFVGSVTYFNGYPATLTGKLGFMLDTNALPDSVVISYHPAK